LIKTTEAAIFGTEMATIITVITAMETIATVILDQAG
jgi:hypothetical protein